MFATALLMAALSLTDVARMSRDEAEFGREVVATGVVTVASEWRANSGVAADPENPNGRGVYLLGEPQMLTRSKATSWRYAAEPHAYPSHPESRPTSSAR